MTDETTEVEETAEEVTEPEQHSGITLAGLNDKVDNLVDLVKSKLTGSPRQTRADESADVAAQVKSEVSKLRAAEEAERKRQGAAGRLDAMEAQIRKLSETAPVEYRKITTWLWGDK